MTRFFSNTVYFLKETGAMLRLNRVSHAVSVGCTALVFFILAMVIAGWAICSHMVDMIRGEAEISAYFARTTDEGAIGRLIAGIRQTEGVREVRLVDENEAYRRMAQILGEDARVLEAFNENPFSPYIEIKINLDKIDAVLKNMEQMQEIEYIRNNRAVLDRLRDITGILQLLGVLIAAAVGITTLVILFHMIRLGIRNKSEQISTLRLLGAQEAFIALPFILEGFFLTLGGGILAAFLSAMVIGQVLKRLAGALPFIPLPAGGGLISGTVLVILLISAVLGIAGSLLGVAVEKRG